MSTASSLPFDALFLAFQSALAGRYSIEREIGRGGSGIVFLAREVHLDRPVAIKLLPPARAADERLKERFLREARLAAKLSHPNVIPIHAVEDRGGFVFYVMAFVDGDTLAQRVRQRGPLPSSEGTRVLREAAWALAYAHGEGLVHRDVKPDNILLERASGRVLVADFGIAAAVGEVSEEGVTGTPEFMSPEQALAQDVDARSDIYSLGATAFYAFSGRLPFEGRTATEILAKHVTEPAPPLDSLGLSVPRKVAHLVDRCLAKDAAQRPASAEALAEQLGVALEQRREVPPALRAFVKRHGRIDSGLAILAPMGMVAAGALVGSFTSFAGGWLTFLAGMTALPLMHFVRSARELSLMGFAHVDLGPAFAAAVEESREEHSASSLRGPSVAERLFGQVAYVMGPFAVGAFLGVVFGEAFGMVGSSSFWFDLVLMTTGPVFIGSLLLKLSLMQRRTDIDTGFWQRMWMGRLGNWAFKVARRLLGTRAIGSAMTHRATELSLGLAAEQLYEALPRETRAALGDLPTLLHRLQDDAQRLRASHDAMQEAINDAGEAATRAEYDDIRAMRDSLHAKLGETVGSLETIRLNLLRLHAGSGSVEGLTTHIGLAAAVSEEVHRLLEARGEVERALAFPREAAATPV
ncbi:MAG: serine/threonine-protein kinase [Gemmatimonadota bacterium]|nr:serine/threonine-protein kinase [Gemmatimonadota bacterium]